MATNPYGSNLGFGGVPATNPYTALQGQAIQDQANQNLKLNVLPGIASGAEAAGGYGGSRQGIAEGVAAGLSQQGVANAQAQLYGNAYNQDENFYTQNRSLDQSGAALGSNLYSAGTTGAVGQGQGVYGVGTTQQTAPWTTTGNASNIFSQYSGLGGGQTQTQNGSALGALTGGALLGSQVISNLGLGSNTGSPGVQAATNVGNQPGTVNANYGDDPYGLNTPQKFADGGAVRTPPVVGSRSPLPSSGGGQLSPEAILRAYMLQRVAASQPAPNLGMGGLPTNPVLNPQGITAAQMQQVDKYAKGGRVSFQGGGAAVGGPPGKDKIPAWVDEGEHVVRATAVTAAGKGSNAKGQAVLDRMQAALDGKARNC